jgi:transcriptional regulator of acetoin/glycerol metabolism
LHFQHASLRAPVLVAGPGVSTRWIADALRIRFSVTVVGDLAVARALARTGAHLAVVAVGAFAAQIERAVTVDGNTANEELIARVELAISETNARERADTDAAELAALPYDEYSAHARYQTTRRYLIGLMHRHRGSVTDAARAAGMVRESLHRLLRRHHLDAEDFR